MEKGKAESNNRWLVVLVCVLLMTVLGLGLGIFLANKNSGAGSDTVYSEDDDGGVQAMTVNQDIESGLQDGSYTMEDAIKAYEYEISFGDTKKRVYLAIDYANFIFEEDEDINMAVDILERVEPLIDDLSMETDYYIALANLYEMAGDTEWAELYTQKVVEMTPKVDPGDSQDWAEESEFEK